MLSDRRALLKGLSAFGAVSGLSGLSPAFAEIGGLRIVSLDYGVAATLLTLGVSPVGLVTADAWDDWVLEPALPDSVVNIGQDRAVNMEVLSALKPDLILSTPYTDFLRPSLEKLARVEMISVYTPDRKPLQKSYEGTRKLGRLLGLEDRAEAFLAEADRAFAASRKKLEQVDFGSVALINFVDARHARIYGASSLYDDVLQRIGMRNAWARQTNFWGFSTIGLEELAMDADQDMSLIVFEPVMQSIKPTLAHSPLWRQLPVVTEDRYTVLPTVLMFGMVPAALRFNRLLLQGLERINA